MFGFLSQLARLPGAGLLGKGCSFFVSAMKGTEMMRGMANALGRAMEEPDQGSSRAFGAGHGPAYRADGNFVRGIVREIILSSVQMTSVV